MSSYPTPSAYQEAVQFPETAFADADLRAATPATNALGLPQPVTGAFAVVFPMEGRTCTWAAKCFLTDAPDQQRRYRAVAAHLNGLDLPHTVGFDYQERGVRVDGAWWPLCKMEWVPGVPLNRYVEAHLEAPEVLQALGEAWGAMIADLEAAGVAHGDLQHGNVLVRETDAGPPALKLVDYDTAYVPALSRYASPEAGHRNYQHPDRAEGDFGPHLDRFPALAVHVALRALALEPGLWRRYDTDENVLFRAADFFDPEASPLFDELSGLGAIRGEVEVLRAACYGPLEAVPRLEEVVSGTADLPMPAQRGMARAAGTWGQRLRTWGPPLAAAGAILLVLSAAFASGWAAAALALVLLAVAAAWVVRSYRREPLVRRRRRLRQEIRYFDRLVAQIDRQVETLRSQQGDVRAEVDARQARRLEQLQEKALYDRLKYHFIHEVGAVEGVSHRAVVRLKAAGIRTAYQVTPDHLRRVTGVGDATKARIAMWRASLVAEYGEAVPDALPASEAQRVERYVAQRREHLQREIRRAEAKRQVQEEERAQGVRRLEALPDLTLREYVRHLLAGRSVPGVEAAPRPRASPPAPAPAPLDQQGGASPADEGPWWAAG